MARLLGYLVMREDGLLKWPVPFENNERIEAFFSGDGVEERKAALGLYLSKVSYHEITYARRTIEKLLTNNYMIKHQVYSKQ